MQVILPQSFTMSMDHALMALFPLVIANRTIMDDDVIQEIVDMLREMLIKSKGLKKYYKHKGKLRSHIHNTCLCAIHRLKYAGRIKGEALCVVTRRGDGTFIITVLGTDKRTWKNKITDEKWHHHRTFIFTVPNVV